MGNRGSPYKGTGKTSSVSVGSTLKLPAWKRRDCPTCKARPGQPCVREVKGRIQEVDLDGGAWYRPLTGPHRARSKRPQETDDGAT